MRGSYSTATPTGPSEPDGAEHEGPFVVEWDAYGERRALRIDPDAFPTPIAARQLGRTWYEVCRELGRVETSMRTGLSEMLNLLSESVSPLKQQSFRLEDLRRTHLDLWEMRLAASHRGAQSDTAYRKSLYVMALLRRHEADHPGTLHDSVLNRLEKGPRLAHHRNEGMAPLSPGEARAWRKWAYLTVRKAALDAGYEGSEPNVQTALHVLLSLSTGEPPEVVRAVEITDVTATSTPQVEATLVDMPHAQRLHWLAQHDLIEQLAVGYSKNRAHEDYLTVYRRRDAALKAYRWAILLNAPAREESGLTPLMLWRHKGSIRQTPWSRDVFRLASVAAEHDLPLEGPQHYARFRKTVVVGEAIDNPKAYLTKGRRHSSATFFGHYTNSPVLRAHAGELLLDSVDGLFEEALRGPTVITADAEEALQDGADVPGMDPATAKAVVSGELDGPHAGCRDPATSPFEEPGTVCTKSMTGTCFGCPNALVLRHHLPAVLAVQQLADPDQAADPAVWKARWKDIYEIITRVILPSFGDEDVAAARTLAHLTPVDLGVANDMRAAREAPTP